MKDVTQPHFAVPFGRQLQSSGNTRGTVLSAVLHVAFLAVVIWAGRTAFENAALSPGAGRGRGGGGGGGGARSVAIWSLPGAAQAQEVPPAPTPPAMTVPETPATIPDPPAEPVPAPAAAPTTGGGPGDGTGTGTGTGPGSGTGTGGGTGSGTGTGVGSDSGEGGGGRLIIPQPQGIIIPPQPAPRNMRGVIVTVTFRISERGEVLDVTTDPVIRDRGYRNEFLDRMRRYTFTPAMTREGRPVAAEFPIQITL